MPILSETLSPSCRLRLAVRTRTPSMLAQTFAAYVGQFYDRGAFDLLAREVRDLYTLDHPGAGARFQQRLDSRLRQRAYPPVAWEISARVGTRAA